MTQGHNSLNSNNKMKVEHKTTSQCNQINNNSISSNPNLINFPLIHHCFSSSLQFRRRSLPQVNYPLIFQCKCHRGSKALECQEEEEVVTIKEQWVQV